MNRTPPIVVAEVARVEREGGEHEEEKDGSVYFRPDKKKEDRDRAERIGIGIYSSGVVVSRFRSTSLTTQSFIEIGPPVQTFYFIGGPVFWVFFGF